MVNWAGGGEVGDVTPPLASSRPGDVARLEAALEGALSGEPRPAEPQRGGGALVVDLVHKLRGRAQFPPSPPWAGGGGAGAGGRGGRA